MKKSLLRRKDPCDFSQCSSLQAWRSQQRDKRSSSLSTNVDMLRTELPHRIRSLFGSGAKKCATRKNSTRRSAPIFSLSLSLTYEKRRKNSAFSFISISARRIFRSPQLDAEKKRVRDWQQDLFLPLPDASKVFFMTSTHLFAYYYCAAVV